MSIEFGVKKEFDSPEYFTQLDKRAEDNSLNIKAVHSRKKAKSLQETSLNAKDKLSFENILIDKISEKKNTKKDEIKNISKITEKEKSPDNKDNKQDLFLNHLFLLQNALKSESLSAAIKDTELKEDRIKEKINSKNILSQLFEKNQKDRALFNPLNYYSNSINGIEKNVNLKESDELKKEKREFFKIVDLRKSSSVKNGESLKAVSDKEITEVSQNRVSIANNNTNQNSADMRELFPGSQLQTASGKLQHFDSSLMTSKNGMSAFHNQFLEYLKENGNSDIVKNANLVLKKNNEGEIKLLMKPESLGYVRIKLMLSDNNIAGKIIVDNYRVKEIFENNIDNLIKNFKENGYSTATIDVSVGGEKNSKEKQSVETGKVLTIKEIEKIEEQSIVRTMLAENRLVDMVV